MPEVIRTICRPLVLIMVSAWLSGALTGCVKQQAQTPPVLPDCPPDSTEQVAALVSRNKDLQSDLSSSRRTIDGLERKVANLEIRMLQKEALVVELQRRTSSQQERLDEAITEVVRTKSKLRTIESKAEAASTIAEAEIAVKSMKSRIEAMDREKMVEFQKAEHLLRKSTQEFKAKNYGGALYLAVQSKAQVSAVDRTVHGHKELATLDGEVAFDQPLPLMLNKNTNLRAGPDLTHQVLTTLEAGTAIVGYAYKEDWIRVHTEAGTIGWVHQSLVMVR